MCSYSAKQIHIPIRTFLAAYRPDLLDKLILGKRITTPHSIRGIDLLHGELTRRDDDETVSNNVSTKLMPVSAPKAEKKVRVCCGPGQRLLYYSQLGSFTQLLKFLNIL